MLKAIREHADSWLIKSILWFIVIAFIGTIFYSWGMGGASSSSGGVVATVNGTKISQAEYERTFNNLINFYREQFQNQFSEELIQKLDLKTQALDALIQKKILLTKADELDIQVSDAEVVNQINRLAAFQKNKVFNNAIYQNYLKLIIIRYFSKEKIIDIQKIPRAMEIPFAPSEKFTALKNKNKQKMVKKKLP